MKKEDMDRDINDALMLLKRRVNEISSNDGLFLLRFNGIGEYISCKFNGDISEMNQEMLESDIIECLNSQKQKVSSDVMNIMLEVFEKEKKAKEDKEDLGVTIENVS